MPNGGSFLNPATGSVEQFLIPVRSTVSGLEGATTPQIYIATSLTSTGALSFSIRFDYMPDSVAMGVAAVFQDNPVPFTSSRWLSYQNSTINEVSAQVKVAAGCNNALTFFRAVSGASIMSSVMGVSGLAMGNETAYRFERASLIKLARALYALPLPQTNQGLGGAEGLPPPTCRFTIGKMFSGVGAFTKCDITFNGPYDYDGSPTDMDVNLSFLPSEFYDSSTFVSGQGNPGLFPTGTPHGRKQILYEEPYALYFNETQTGQLQTYREGKAADEAALQVLNKTLTGSQNAQPTQVPFVGTPEAQAAQTAIQQSLEATKPQQESPTPEFLRDMFNTLHGGSISTQDVIRHNGTYTIGGVPYSAERIAAETTQYRNLQSSQAAAQAGTLIPGLPGMGGGGSQVRGDTIGGWDAAGAAREQEKWYQSYPSPILPGK